MLVLHTNLDPVRRSLFLALGLLVGCGGDGGGTDTSTSGPGSSSSGEAPTTTGDAGTSTGTSGTTTSASGTGSTGGTSTTEGSTTGEASSSTSGVVGTTTTGETGGTTTTGGTTEGSSSESSETGDPNCTPLMQGTDPPIPSGWEQCGDGLPHRVEALECESLVTATPCNNMIPENMCNEDADCTDQPFGSCNQFSNLLLFCGCVYACQTDADCAAGQVCRCGGPELGAFTTCVPAECVQDSDCPDGEVCQFSTRQGEDCPLEVSNGNCSTPNDTCSSDSECGPGGCGFFDGKWECANTICGRPFVVEDVAVTAEATGRDDWRGLVACVTAPADVRARLAAHWTRIGLYEHASVASFARFILQLLAVGAPASLVAAAQEALADEVEHARVCFALASLYEGTGVGPGPLAQAQAAGATTLADITAAVIREACVGETLSALEVREAAARAEDPGLRRALAKIADDEQRHAELGWRFVQWARTQPGAPDVAEVFAEAIADAEVQAARLAGEAAAPELRAHGVVDAPLQAVVWRSGLARLVRPSADALLMRATG